MKKKELPLREGHGGIKRKSTLREYVETVAIAVVITLLVRAFVVQAFRIPSESMEPTLLVGDFLFANKFIYGAQVPYTDIRLPKVRDPEPGDIIVFRYPRDTSQDFIKRCVAVGGQTVEMRRKRLYVDGKPVEENYVIHSDSRYLPARDDFGPYRVPPGYVFMLGDNRDNSQDSRFWGPLDVKLIKGKAMIIYWSWNKERFLPRLGRIFSLIR